jgi:hypothetical protein
LSIESNNLLNVDADILALFWRSNINRSFFRESIIGRAPTSVKLFPFKINADGASNAFNPAANAYA